MKLSSLNSLSFRVCIPFVVFVAVFCVSVLALPMPLGLFALHILPEMDGRVGKFELLLLRLPFDAIVEGVSGTVVRS